MAFLSPWRQMRVSKPRLSWCDPKKQNGWEGGNTAVLREHAFSSGWRNLKCLLIKPESCNCTSDSGVFPHLLIHAPTAILIFQSVTQDKWNYPAQWDRLCQRARLIPAGQVFQRVDRGRLQLIANYFGLQLYSVFPEQVMELSGMPTAAMCLKHVEIKKCGYTNFENSAALMWKWLKNPIMSFKLLHLNHSEDRKEGRTTGGRQKEYVRDKLREAENERTSLTRAEHRSYYSLTWNKSKGDAVNLDVLQST